MSLLRVQFDHVKSVLQIRRHFENPWLLILFRLGLIKVPYFLHRINGGGHHYALLARPTTTSKADLFVLREVLVDESYSGVLPLLKNKNIRLLDVGANLGSFTIWMHRKVGVREAFCFEPEPDSFRLLNFNLAMNDCPTAKTLPSALGGEARTIRILLKKSSPGGTSIYANAQSPEATAVPVLALQGWMAGIQGDFDLLKMDCEGAEWEILQKTDPRQFGRFQTVVAEVHGDPENKRQVSEFKDLIEKVGFRTVRWDNHPQGLYIGARR